MKWLENKLKVTIKARCNYCKHKWVLVRGKPDKVKQYVLPEEIPCPACGNINLREELQVKK